MVSAVSMAHQQRNLPPLTKQNRMFHSMQNIFKHAADGEIPLQ